MSTLPSCLRGGCSGASHALTSVSTFCRGRVGGRRGRHGMEEESSSLHPRSGSPAPAPAQPSNAGPVRHRAHLQRLRAPEGHQGLGVAVSDAGVGVGGVVLARRREGRAEAARVQRCAREGGDRRDVWAGLAAEVEQQALQDSCSHHARPPLTQMISKWRRPHCTQGCEVKAQATQHQVQLSGDDAKPHHHSRTPVRHTTPHPRPHQLQRGARVHKGVREGVVHPVCG